MRRGEFRLTAPAVREQLASYAGLRQRAVDDHMFTVTRDGYPVGTFQLQLFTAAGTGRLRSRPRLRVRARPWLTRPRRTRPRCGAAISRTWPSLAKFLRKQVDLHMRPCIVTRPAGRHQAADGALDSAAETQAADDSRKEA